MINKAITQHYDLGNFKSFKRVCSDAIKEATIELQNHRGWKQWLANFTSKLYKKAAKD